MQHITSCIFPEEDRFEKVCQELKDLAYKIWSIYQIDIQSLLGKILFVEKPSEQDKEYLNSHFGYTATEKFVVVESHDHRRDLLKQGNEAYKKKRKFFSKDLAKSRAILVEESLEKYKRLTDNMRITPSEAVNYELIYDILYPTPVYQI